MSHDAGTLVRKIQYAHADARFERDQLVDDAGLREKGAQRFLFKFREKGQLRGLCHLRHVQPQALLDQDDFLIQRAEEGLFVN